MVGPGLDSPTVDPLCSWPSGLGLPDRRWAPGETWGPFCFLATHGHGSIFRPVAWTAPESFVKILLANTSQARLGC